MRNQTFSRLLGAAAAAGAVLAVAVPAAQAQASKTDATPTVTAATTSTVTTAQTSTTPATTTPTTPVTKKPVRKKPAAKNPAAKKPKTKHRLAKASSTAPAKIKYARIHLAQLFALDGHDMTVAGREVHMTAEVAPYVAGQWVKVTISVAGHVTRQFITELKHGSGNKYGWISANAAAPRIGHVTVTVSRVGNDKLAGFATHAYYFTLAHSANYGNHGWLVQLVQRRLAILHIFIHQTGVFDAQTGWAMNAYHRLVGRGTAGTMDPTIVNDLLDGKGVFHVRFPNQGRHAEGDLSDQLLALINGKQVWAIFPISSGKESTPTILGSYRIYRRVPGYLPDGMYYSDFFIRGYAIHGYDPAPNYPASHGCMRLWINDAIPVFNWLAMGDWVDTYGTAPYHLGLGYL